MTADLAPSVLSVSPPSLLPLPLISPLPLLLCVFFMCIAFFHVIHGFLLIASRFPLDTEAVLLVLPKMSFVSSAVSFRPMAKFAHIRGG